MKTKNKLPFKCSETFKEYLIGRFERENEKDFECLYDALMMYNKYRDKRFKKLDEDLLHYFISFKLEDSITPDVITALYEARKKLKPLPF